MTYDPPMRRTTSDVPRTSRSWERLHQERGAAAVEFALLAPILILLVFGIIQFSIVYNQVQGLHAAAREGARLGSLPSSSAGEIEARVAEALDGIPLNNGYTITELTTCEGDAETSVVRIQADYNIVIPVWGEAAKTLSGRGEFKCE